MIGGIADRDKIGINKVDFAGQTGDERSVEEQQREPGDYEAQVAQGPITIHSQERPGKTDVGVAMLRRLLRRQIRAVAGGENPRGSDLNADGRISTYTGDFLVRIPPLAGKEELQQRDFGRKLAKILIDTCRSDSMRDKPRLNAVFWRRSSYRPRVCNSEASVNLAKACRTDFQPVTLKGSQISLDET